MGNFTTRTQTESDAILTLATDAMEKRMNAGDSFTALDISNDLKARNFPVRHREVSAVVRGLYAGNGMITFGYDRTLIPVTTATGTEQAYLYHHGTTPTNYYTAAAQTALAPVSASQARALDDVTPAGEPLSPLAEAALRGMVGGAVITGTGATAWGKPSQSRRVRTGKRSAYRCDGAVAVPRKLIEGAGYQEGDLLILTHDAQTGTLVLAPATGSTVLGAFVKVWGDLRVRIAKTKWGVAGFSGQVTPAQKPQMRLDAVGSGVVRIAP